MLEQKQNLANIDTDNSLEAILPVSMHAVYFGNFWNNIFQILRQGPQSKEEPK